MEAVDRVFDPKTAATAHALPPPMDEKSYSRGAVVPFGALTGVDGWRKSCSNWGKVPGAKRAQFVRGDAIWSDVPGSSPCCHFGADTPWDYGLYFWWGDTTGHRPGYNFSSGNSAIYTCGKSVSELQSAGWVTSSGVLAPSHDAAHVKWGGAWRMPTDAEFSALIHNCDWTWTTQSGVNGYVVRGRGAYASNSIILPAAGYCYGTSLYNSGPYGYYWSSVPHSGYNGAYELLFGSGNYYADNVGSRFDGQSVRPVQGLAK